jgi:hypothetical protein
LQHGSRFSIAGHRAYPPILQGAVALKCGANAKGGVAFLRYLHSPAAMQQLQRGGLAPVQQ